MEGKHRELAATATREAVCELDHLNHGNCDVLSCLTWTELHLYMGCWCSSCASYFIWMLWLILPVVSVFSVPSVLWRCWLGGRKGIRPIKNWVVRCWHGYLFGTRCRLAYMAQLMPLPLTVSCFSKIQIGFTILVPAHLGSLGERAVKRVCVCG